MGVRQFNVQYSLPEDRLVLRFATDDDCEYALWFTRFITRGFIVSVLELVTRTQPKDQISGGAPIVQVDDIPRREAGEAYQAPSQSPMGNAPLLVTELNVSLNELGVEMVFGLAEGQHLTVLLPQPTVEAMVAMLQDIQAKVGWALTFNDRPTPIVLESVDEALQPLH